MTLKEAVERFTARVAEMFDLPDRGYLRPGAYADIVIFDLAAMRDYPDVFAARPKLATGVEHLLINGEPVIDQGRFREALPGKILRNTRQER
jgi:N-acyl-D-aspartate/D-glutamate deacylase